MYSNTFLFFILFFLRYFSLFELAGWPKRAIIARGSQRVSEGYCCALSLRVCACVAAQKKADTKVGVPPCFRESYASCAQLAGELKGAISEVIRYPPNKKNSKTKI